MARILVVDDDPFSREMLEEGLVLRGFSVTTCSVIEQAREHVRADESLSVVLTDLRLAGESGLDLCRAVNRDRPALPVIVITAFGSISTAMDAMRAGAYDFITKPFELEVIAVSLDRAAKHNELNSELTRLRRVVVPEQALGSLIGASAAMHRAFDLIVPRSRFGCDGAGHWREWYRQGTGRQSAPRPERSQDATLRGHQLCGNPREPPGERVVRACARALLPTLAASARGYS